MPQVTLCCGWWRSRATSETGADASDFAAEAKPVAGSGAWLNGRKGIFPVSWRKCPIRLAGASGARVMMDFQPRRAWLYRRV